VVVRDHRRAVSWLVSTGSVTLFLLLVAVAYAFFLSAGQFDSWFQWTAFYDAQAEGFRAGHLYVAEPAPPELQVLIDPLNPANIKHWRWDYSYYDGRLYIYWGLVPAALLAVAKTLLQIRATVGDEVIAFFFLIGRALAGVLIIREFARHHDPEPPTWAVWLAATVVAFANPIPIMLSRPAIYEASIAAGSCFMLLGTYFALRALHAEREAGTLLWLLSASFGLGLAAGARISLQPAVVLMLALTVFVLWRIGGAGIRRFGRLLVCGAMPAMLVVGSQLLLNYLRFGLWNEFGTSYQMTAPRFHIGARFVIPNLYLYLLEPIGRKSCWFPFFSAQWYTAKRVLPEWLSHPADYFSDEPNVGLLRFVPFVWLIFGGIGLSLWDTWRRQESRCSARKLLTDTWRVRWAWGVFTIWTVGAAMPILLAFMFTMRYQADFTAALLLLATLAGWRILATPESRTSRSIVVAIYVTLATTTVIFGLLLGFGEDYSNNFKLHNPGLMTRLEELLSLCRWRRHWPF